MTEKRVVAMTDGENALERRPTHVLNSASGRGECVFWAGIVLFVMSLSRGYEVVVVAVFFTPKAPAPILVNKKGGFWAIDSHSCKLTYLDW